MSLIKRELERNETYYAVAFNLLEDIGAIKTCPIHGSEHFYETGMEESEVYALATHKLKIEFPELNDFSLFHQKIKEVLQDSAIEKECPICEKLWNE